MRISQSSSRDRSFSRGLRAAGAAAISVAMVGVLALPAYAGPTVTQGQGGLDPAIQAQALSTSEFAALAVPAALPTAAEQPLPAAVALAVAENPGRATAPTVDAAASATGHAIVDAALAQLGVLQDCTDLVQNSLAELGLVLRRDRGGYDHGTISLQQFGVPVTDGQWAPGDILGWPGSPHVAIYIGEGLAVHGGMGGSTVIASATDYFGVPAYVVRPG